MADIKSFKSSAGEVFVCFNEQSHSYKLFLNMLKNAELSSDTAIKNLATSINKAVSEAVIENQAKGVVAQNNVSDGGLTHSALTNITNKLDLMFNALSSLKSFKPEPIQHKLDTEALDVFGQRLEESLGALVTNKLSAMPSSSTPSLPNDFVEKAVAAIAINMPKVTLDTSKIQEIVSGIQGIVQKGVADMERLTADKVIMPINAQTQQINAISHATTPAVQDKLTLQVEKATTITLPQQEPKATEIKPAACQDMVIRYPAQNKKTKPSCYGQHLPGDVSVSPCPTCAWINDCSQKKDAAKPAEKSNQPECFGSHRGDLDCSVCQFDEECAKRSC